MAGNLPDRQQILHVAILNSNPSIGADAELTNGYINVFDSAGTGAGWSNVSGNPTIRWKDVLVDTVLGGIGTWFLPYQLGSFQTIGVNLTTFTPAIGDTWIVTVTKIDGSTQDPYTQIFTYICASAVLATEVTAFAAMITAQSQSNVTAVNNAQVLEITGAFGDVNIETFGTQVIPGGRIQAAPLSVVTPLAQASGTPQIVGSLLPASVITANQYNTYGLKFYNHVGADEGVKQNELVPMTALVFVNNAADAGVGSFNENWVDILSGVYNPQTAYN